MQIIADNIATVRNRSNIELKESDLHGLKGRISPKIVEDLRNILCASDVYLPKLGPPKLSGGRVAPSVCI
jgi:hypothetical protein